MVVVGFRAQLPRKQLLINFWSSNNPLSWSWTWNVPRFGRLKPFLWVKLWARVLKWVAWVLWASLGSSVRFLIVEIIPVGFELCGVLGTWYLLPSLTYSFTDNNWYLKLLWLKLSGLRKSCKPFVAQAVPDVLNYGGNNEPSITD